MKKVTVILFLLLAGKALHAQATAATCDPSVTPTFTPNLQLPLVGNGQCNWGVTYNSVTSMLDSFLSGSSTIPQISVSQINSASALGHLNLSAAGVSFSNNGLFKAKQMNDYLVSLTNGCNTGTEHQAGQGTGQFATESIVGCLIIPSSSTISHGYPLAAYLQNFSTTTQGVAMYSQGRAKANNTRTWGGGAVVADISGLTGPVQLIGFEADLAVNNASSVYAGGVNNIFRAAFYSQSSGLIAGTHGLDIESILTGWLNTGIQIGDGAANTGIYIGTLHGSAARASQTLVFGASNGPAAANVFSTLKADANGSLAVSSPTQVQVNINNSDAVLVVNNTNSSGQAWALDAKNDGSASIFPKTTKTANLGLHNGLKATQKGLIIAPGTFAELIALFPCNSENEGAEAAITDSSTKTWGATISGSSMNHVLGYCDGSNWTVIGK